MSDLKIIQTEDGSHSIFNSALNETYHSVHGAIQESDHVFINAGLKHWLQHDQKQQLRIFEVGFGTGLNALLTYIHLNNSISTLYHSVEKFPIEDELIARLNYTDQLGYQKEFKSMHSAPWTTATAISPAFTLVKQRVDLINDPVESTHLFDIIYYDAFGPSKQSEMWTIDVLRKVVELMTENGIFVTYCAKGQVKRDLKQLGLKVETLPGPPGKLQMIRAVKPRY